MQQNRETLDGPPGAPPDERVNVRCRSGSEGAEASARSSLWPSPARQRLAPIDLNASFRDLSRKYSEAELRAILAKAVEEGEGVSPSGVDGISLAEIKEIGAEVGIDPDSLERAARSVASAGGGYQSALAGAPVSVSVARRIEREFGSVPTNEILSVIREGMGRPGDLSELNDLLEWRSSGELGQRAITISCTDGVTTVTGMADLTQAAVVTHLPLSLLGVFASVGGFLTAANNGSEFGMVLCTALLPAVLLGTRRLFGFLSRSESTKLERAVEEVAELVRASERVAEDSTGTT